eukprot:gene17636-5526_t
MVARINDNMGMLNVEDSIEHGQWILNRLSNYQILPGITKLELRQVQDGKASSFKDRFLVMHYMEILQILTFCSTFPTVLGERETKDNDDGLCDDR